MSNCSGIFTLPNLLSLMRLPLAIIFLKQNVFLRVLALLAAMLTDYLDGYLARKNKTITRVGTLLDPITDKFFVFFVLGIFLQENRLSLGEALTLMCRDFSVILFGIFLAFKGQLANYQFRSIWCGKVATALQFAVLMALTLEFQVYSAIYGIFIFLGILALAELYLSPHQIRLEHET